MTHPVYLIRGDELLVSEALQRLRAELDVDPLSEVVFEADAEAAELMNSLNTASLLSSRRVVLVRDAHDLGKEQLAALASYLEAPSPDVTLVMTAASKTKLDDAVKKAGAVLALEAPRGRALAGWTRERASASGFKLDDRGAWALIDAVGTELRDLAMAVDQLATGAGAGARVGAADVRRTFPRLADERIFAFTDAVGERRLPAALIALRRLLGQDEHPLVVTGALVAQIRRMLRAHPWLTHGSTAIAAAVGLPEWRAERLSKQARNYREDELVRSLQLLAATDLELKGDYPAEAVEAALERAVVEIVVAGGISAKS